MSINSNNLEIIESNEPPSLATMQNVVGEPGKTASIEVVYYVFGDSEIVIICDEEGKLKHLPKTLMNPNDCDFIVGQVIMLRWRRGSEEFELLTRTQVTQVLKSVILHF